MIKMDCIATLDAESRDSSDVKQRNEVVLMLSSEFDNQNLVLQVVQANPSAPSFRLSSNLATKGLGRIRQEQLCQQE